MQYDNYVLRVKDYMDIEPADVYMRALDCPMLDPKFRIVYKNVYTIEEFAEKYKFQDSLLFHKIDPLTTEYILPRKMPDWIIKDNNIIIYLTGKYTERNIAESVLVLAAPPVLTLLENTITLVWPTHERKYDVKEFASKHNLMHILRNQLIIAALNL